MRHIVCFSKSHNSALAAIEVVRRFGNENVILLHHAINPKYEHPDVKRFGYYITEYLKLSITYANRKNIDDRNKLLSQFSLCELANTFDIGGNQAVCSNRLKHNPFREWLKTYGKPGNDVIYYPFTINQIDDATRVENALKLEGYRTEFPLIFWKTTIRSTEEIGIASPLAYSVFKGIKCIGCIRANKTHWYAVYYLFPEIWLEAKEAERCIEQTIFKDESLDELEVKFQQMKKANVLPMEISNPKLFWDTVNSELNLSINDQPEALPCECSF